MLDYDSMNEQFGMIKPAMEENFGMSSDMFDSFASSFQKEHMFDTNQPSTEQMYKSAMNYMEQEAEERKKQERIAREERLADIASAKMTSDAFRDLGRSLDSFGRTGVGFLG